MIYYRNSRKQKGRNAVLLFFVAMILLLSGCDTLTGESEPDSFIPVTDDTAWTVYMVPVISNEAPQVGMVELYFDGTTLFMGMEDAATLTGYQISNSFGPDNTGTISLNRGVREVVIDIQSRELIDYAGITFVRQGSIPFYKHLPGGEPYQRYLVEAWPMMHYLGAQVEVSADGFVLVHMPDYVVWDALMSDPHEERIDYVASKGGEVAANIGIFTDHLHDLLNGFSGHGAEIIIDHDVHIKDAFERIPATDIMEYSMAQSVIAEANLKDQALFNSNQVSGVLKAAKIANKGVSGYSGLYETYLNIGFDKSNRAHSLFAEIGEEAFSEMKMKYSGIADTADKFADGLDEAVCLLNAWNTMNERLSYDVYTKELIKRALTEEVYAHCGHRFALEDSARHVSVRIESEENIQAYAQYDYILEEAFDTVIDLVKKMGARAVTSEFATNMGVYANAMKYGLFISGSVTELLGYNKAYSSDLDAFYLSEIQKELLKMLDGYLFNHGSRVVTDKELLQEYTDVLRLFYRTTLALADARAEAMDKFSNDADKSTKVRDLRDKNEVSVANRMAGKSCMINICDITPIPEYQSAVMADTDLETVIEIASKGYHVVYDFHLDEPVPGAVVTLYSYDEEKLYNVLTDKRGTIELSVPDGEYAVAVTAYGYHGLYTSFRVVNGRARYSEYIYLRPIAEHESVPLQVHPSDSDDISAWPYLHESCPENMSEGGAYVKQLIQLPYVGEFFNADASSSGEQQMLVIYNHNYLEGYPSFNINLFESGGRVAYHGFYQTKEENHLTGILFAADVYNNAEARYEHQNCLMKLDMRYDPGQDAMHVERTMVEEDGIYTDTLFLSRGMQDAKNGAMKETGKGVNGLSDLEIRQLFALENALHWFKTSNGKLPGFQPDFVVLSYFAATGITPNGYGDPDQGGSFLYEGNRLAEWTDWVDYNTSGQNGQSELYQWNHRVTYDEYNNTAEMELELSNGYGSHVEKWQLDTEGNMTGSTVMYSVTPLYDEKNRLTGYLDREKWDGGESVLEYAFTYDDQGRIVEMRAVPSAGDDSVYYRRYEYEEHDGVTVLSKVLVTHSLNGLWDEVIVEFRYDEGYDEGEPSHQNADTSYIGRFEVPDAGSAAEECYLEIHTDGTLEMGLMGRIILRGTFEQVEHEDMSGVVFEAEVPVMEVYDPANSQWTKMNNDQYGLLFTYYLEEDNVAATVLHLGTQAYDRYNLKRVQN